MKNRLLVILCIGLVLVAISVWAALHSRQQRAEPLQATQATPPKQAPTPTPTLPAPSEQPLSKGVSATKVTAISGKLHAGGREWSLGISDSSVPNEARMVIARDLNLIFGHLPVTVIDKLPFPIDGQLNGKKVQLTHSVRLEGGARKGPKELREEPFMCLVDGKEENGIYIPKEVTDAYLQAIERSRKYNEAYDKLRQMLEALNHLEERPIANVKDLFLPTDDNKSVAAGQAQIDDAAFASAWANFKFREPSLLQVTETRGTPLEKFGVLAAQIYEGTNLNDFFPLIYRNGRWQILVARGE